MIIKPRVETSVREVSLRIYLDTQDCDGVLRKSDDYDAVASVFIYGTKAFIYSIHGGGFYLGFLNSIEELRKYGVLTVEGYVMEPHARLVKREAKKAGLDVLITDPECAFDRAMRWVVVRTTPHHDGTSSDACSTTSS